jgi:hypothetical protein
MEDEFFLCCTCINLRTKLEGLKFSHNIFRKLGFLLLFMYLKYEATSGTFDVPDNFSCVFLRLYEANWLWISQESDGI